MQEITPVDRLQLPADIRKASPEDQRRYASAQQFELMLVQKMMTQATSLPFDDEADGTGEGDDESGGATDAVTSHFKEVLPELMAKSMTAGDGVGIARDLYNAMQQKP